jgi:hypothetical protein
MTAKIEQKITGYKVKTEEVIAPEPAIPSYHESHERPEIVRGKTYKIKPGDHAFYITINDAEIDGAWRPIELFVNTKDVRHFMWVMIFSRLVSAILRKGGQYEFMIDEMKAIIDPDTGGYWKKGEGHVPSLIADIGNILEKHIKALDTTETCH